MYAADARHPNKSLEEKLQALYLLRSGPSIDLTIREPYKNLLAALGNPQDHLPPVIHVAGTNGKGSVVAMLRAVFEQAGYRAHVYTSPHLVRFNERIVLAGREIGDDLLESLLDETVAANNGGALTFFEITTAMAFLAFSRVPADILLMETGLGGRLDCTNVVTRPMATVITRIGYDHMEFLGPTLPEIAAEKAGIMKPGVSCILAPQTGPDIIAIFAGRARELGCDLDLTEPANAPPTNMTGPHQRDNAATALACLTRMLQHFDIPPAAIEKGMMNVRWPGRLQKIDRPGLAAGAELWVDGGHNESAGHALAAQAALWRRQDGKKLNLVLGMMRRKDPVAFIAPLLPYLARVSCVAVPDEDQAFTPAELAALITDRCGIKAEPEDIGKIRGPAITQPDTRILVAGSLYLAGYMLRDS